MILIWILFTNFGIGGRPAFASLGGPEASVATDSVAFRGVAHKLSRRTHGYTVQEISQTRGHRKMRILEYVLPDGTVFAVSWRGTGQPDLSVLLGSSFASYQQAAAVQGSHPQRGRGFERIRAGSLVVEKFGPMRDLRGWAYLLDKLPEGIRPEEFQ